MCVNALGILMTLWGEQQQGTLLMPGGLQDA